jgi:hypothetical protein
MGYKPAFSHTHEQSTPSNTWTIVHGLNCKPSIAVQINYNGQIQTIIPNSIAYTDDNTVVVGFTSPYSGTARLF